MIDRRWWLIPMPMLACGWLAGCAAQGADDERVGVSVAALSACNETVPADRYVDGIPAYAQCDAAANSAIYSNNGVDTSLTAMGSDWIKTQYSGGYQCTELAHRYLHFKWQVDWIPNGNAGEWCDTQPPAGSGLVQTTTPVHGDVMVLLPGSCGAAAVVGHVNVIDVVDSSSGHLTAVEQNNAGRNSFYTMSCAKCFLHVVANDGANMGASIPSGSGGSGGAAGVGAGGAGGMGAAGAPAGPAIGTGGAVAAGMGTGGMSPLPPMAPQTPPVVPPVPASAPVMMAPAMTAPADVAATTGSGGAAAMTPVAISPRQREVSNPGCAVVRAGGGRDVAPQAGAAWALALAALGRRRRSGARRGSSDAA